MADHFGHKGELMWLPVDQLLIDTEYQRYLNKKKAADIVANYDADVVGVLICSRRSDGAIYVLDGQHRKEAADDMKQDGQVMLMPCFVMSGLSRVQEASTFWKLNKNRLHPTSMDTFRARLAAGEPVAHAIKNETESLGITLQLYPQPLGQNEVGALAALEQMFHDGTLVPVLSMIRTVWANEPGAFRASMLLGLRAFYLRFWNDLYIDKNHEDKMERLRETLVSISPRDVDRRAKIYAESASERAATSVARAVYYYYQRKLKSGRTKLPDWSVDADAPSSSLMDDEYEAA